LADQDGPALTDDSRRTIARLASDTLPRLIERLTKSQLGELEVREDGWRIRLRRPIADVLETSAADGRPARDRARAAGAVAGGAAHADRQVMASRSTHSQRPESTRGLVTSPGVGYFVAREGVVVGFKVSSGDLLGHVDVLGVRQEIVAPIEGVVAAVEVEGGQAIEYGQPVARVEANVQ